MDDMDRHLSLDALSDILYMNEQTPGKRIGDWHNGTINILKELHFIMTHALSRIVLPFFPDLSATGRTRGIIQILSG